MQELLISGLLLWGFLAGFMGGLLGIGGGIVFVLVIPEAAAQLGVLPENMVSATIANSLVCTFFTTFAAGIRRFSADKIVRQSVLMIGISSTLVSILILRFVVNAGLLSAQYFHYFFLAILLYLILRIFMKLRAGRNEADPDIRYSNPVLFATGVFSGIVSPLSGLGGGIVVVPVLHGVLHFPISLAQAVSFGVIALSTFFSSVFNLFETAVFPSGIPAVGLLILPIILSLAPAAILGALVGSGFAGKLPSRWSSGLLMLFLLFIFIRKLFSPI